MDRNSSFTVEIDEIEFYINDNNWLGLGMEIVAESSKKLCLKIEWQSGGSFSSESESNLIIWFRADCIVSYKWVVISLCKDTNKSTKLPTKLIRAHLSCSRRVKNSKKKKIKMPNSMHIHNVLSQPLYMVTQNWSQVWRYERILFSVHHK